MNEKREMTQQQSKTTQPADKRQQILRPAADIFEDKTGITLKADMPGVSREQLDIQVDQDTLSIEGSTDIVIPTGMQPGYADVSATSYQRSFTLSSELDTDKIDASLRDGVLTLHIPKREQYQPRKIEVRMS
ncbi:MAG: Hsp20/alpha crystallin family protein [Candidatus Thiodiazotropha sp. (ex Myrtea spinifera)]|nr:Hsp20/alpha crystallin family protein [Candidatus Thiodiazotropha sp. (ex Myrtea spinifera)]